jgi:hypothetical protein
MLLDPAHHKDIDINKILDFGAYLIKRVSSCRNIELMQSCDKIIQ